MHESILVYRSFRYLKWASLLCLAAIIAYAVQQPLGGVPNGGTWLGYTLGTIGALLILWLMWLGIRKRRYGPGTGMLEDWLSAHVYLGLALIIVATLHTGFQFGLNLHMLAYVLMIIVILSGMFGVYAYVRYPVLMTENRRGESLAQIMINIAELDAECRRTAMPLGDEINALVLAAGNSQIGGGFFRQLSGRDPACPTAAALRRLSSMAPGGDEDGGQALRNLVALLTRKDELLQRARRDVRFKALMDVWLYVHVPLSFALLAALAGHVFSVFFYW